MKTLFFSFVFLVASVSVFACSEDGSTGFVPENDIYIPVDAKRTGGLTEQQFNDVIDEVETLYSPIVASMGAKLKVARLWSNGTANANASRGFGGKWNINMYGGLARHSSITPDGFALVLCHELGHHLGGAPKVKNFIMGWASNEGQSDYFATLKCLRKVFNNDNNSAIVSSMNVPETLAKACSANHPNALDRDICIRTGMAGVSVAGFFAALRNKPEASFDTPDTKVVSKTDDSHPAHQCRLDTFFQGSLCEASMNEDVSQKNEVTGTCHNSLGHKVGLRPLCWFKPSVL